MLRGLATTTSTREPTIPARGWEGQPPRQKNAHGPESSSLPGGPRGVKASTCGETIEETGNWGQGRVVQPGPGHRPEYRPRIAQHQGVYLAKRICPMGALQSLWRSFLLRSFRWDCGSGTGEVAAEPRPNSNGAAPIVHGRIWLRRRVSRYA
jgi:hypothetical protein